MKVTIVGKRMVKYTKRETGELKEGIEVFYLADRDGVEGKICDNLWFNTNSRYYGMLVTLDVTKPLEADVVNEVPPGGRFPEITEFKILSNK